MLKGNGMTYTPYLPVVQEAQDVLKNLMIRMTYESEMKIFKNMASVYVIWQHELQNLQLEELNWRTKNDLLTQ